jgi:hypothetical protein
MSQTYGRSVPGSSRLLSIRRRGEQLSRPVDENLLSGFQLGAIAGPFDDFAADESRSGTDQGDEVRCVDRRQRSRADWMSLNVVASPAGPRAGQALASLSVSFSNLLRRSAYITRNRQPRSRTHLTCADPAAQTWKARWRRQRLPAPEAEGQVLQTSL